VRQVRTDWLLKRRSSSGRKNSVRGPKDLTNVEGEKEIPNEELPEEGMGVAFFRNAVEYIRNHLL